MSDDRTASARLATGLHYVGVDPGKHGAIAIIDAAGQPVELLATPMLAGGKIYDVDAIAWIFRRRADPGRADRGLHVTVEDLQMLPAFRPRKKGEKPEPMGGAKAQFNRGVAHGWEWMLAAFRIRPLMVRPQTWQRAVTAGMPGSDPKARSIATAKQLFPTVCLVCGAVGACAPAHPRRTVPQDKWADALNVAEHGRRKHQGGALFARAASLGGGASA